MSYAAIVVTGETRLHGERDVQYIARAVESLSADLWVTGAAFGADVAAAWAALESHRDAEHLICVPAAPHDDESVEQLAAEGALEYPVPPVRGGYPEQYMERNDEMVRRATGGACLAFPRTRREVQRSGSWATIRRARKAGLEVILRPLEEAPAIHHGYR